MSEFIKVYDLRFITIKYQIALFIVSVSQQVVFLVHDGQWPGWPIRRPVPGPASVAEDSGQCGGGECQSGAQSQAVTGRGVSEISQ